ncbi:MULTISPECIES: hypothetical protein [unclassified Streptomyces]|uniref:hypothetical protein n=1 Tax=unclassified Streptomyces TaxID=2593676 RepID=UPI003D8D1ECA
MLDEARRGITSPAVLWTAEGTNMEARADTLDELSQLVGENRVKKLTLKVTDPVEDPERLIMIEFGSLNDDLQGLFMGFLATYEDRWDTTTTLRALDRHEVEEKAARLKRALDRTRILRQATWVISLVAALLQTWLLWYAILGLPKFIAMQSSGTAPENAATFILGVTFGFFLIHWATGEGLLSFRTKLENPGPGWWAHLVNSPNRTAA